jgi:uncharacterized protein YoxC
MNPKKISLMSLAVSLIVLLAGSGSVFAETSSTMELVGLLTSQLGVTEKQATGGAGSLFQMAKENLSAEDFGKVASAVPGIDSLISAAPMVKEVAGSLGGVSEGLGAITKAADSASKLATVTSQFSKLGLDAGMVSQFIPIILNFVNNTGGEEVMKILQAVWS